MVGDVGYCTPKPMEVCEDLRDDDKPDLGDEWKDWNMDDQELESDDETEDNVWKKRKRKDLSEGKIIELGRGLMVRARYEGEKDGRAEDLAGEKSGGM